MTGATASLHDLRSADEEHFGGKSAALGELLAGGIPVPPGFAVSADAFSAFVASTGIEAEIADALYALDVGDVRALTAASERVGAAIHGVAMPDALAGEIAARYDALPRPSGEDEPAVAVRSSACGEDSAEATFAGQQETYLWVRGVERVRAAVRDCWASLYSAPAIAYRARMGVPHGVPAMGVAVQLMVDAAVAGVMFTCNPVTGDPSVVAINASWGLGLGVVGGDVTPDEFLVNKVSRDIVRRTINRKEAEHRPLGAGGGTERVALDESRATAASLDDEQLRALVDVARTVQAHFGSHQDIEWALGGDGELYVLQSRPVTVAPSPAAATAAPAGASAVDLIMSRFGAGAAGGSSS